MNNVTATGHTPDTTQHQKVKQRQVLPQKLRLKSSI